MLLKEYRVVMNCTEEEYQVAQLYAVAEQSKEETGDGDGVEVRKNEPYENEFGKGQYTYKVYHLTNKVPGWVRSFAPKGSLELYEEAWNGYPYCKTGNNGYMKENFELTIETMHVGNSRGEIDNALKLSEEELKMREVTIIDIANDKVDKKDYRADEDPSLYTSEKTGRGPLKGDWIPTVEPVMTCYKVVRIKFVWRLLQNKVEAFIASTVRSLFTNFSRKLFCWTDKWYGMTMEDIRALEEKTKHELDEKRKQNAEKAS
ncbi:hypothetical protein THASP1DRAFT_34681 [Thamnocephalis sphaerospora]|uniref:Phosphatidylinositol transfer protein N-terminal domain-containing protein n=1 Tax=Thamnocephalis sphaerospora TaxID=78915 RepID=A0A4P9XQS3_9FUNG|nr:hypothetical protein THASP1DRAFT_34681 [Thamnocephalis sphaerospora]|eukprot:RKP08404.1 hypothetical protein THASP1DRAFT_34681 [Thamnocephalis sphaerospora]